jgi:hypothetical protein
MVSIGYFEIFEGTPVLKEIIDERLSPSAIIEESLKLALRHGCCLIAVESNAFQYSLLHWFGVKTNQMGIIGINCVDIYSGGLSKNSRILTMFKGLTGINNHTPGAIKKPEQYIGINARTQVFAQITSFNPLKTSNIDGILDLLTYSVRVMETYGEFILSGLTLQMQEFSGIPVRTELETNDF